MKKTSGPPLAKEGEPTKIFTVSPGFSIGGFDGRRKNSGDEIELTHGQATYFLRLGAITLELPEFGDDDEPELELDAFGDPAEDGTGSEADGKGDSPTGNGAGTPAL